MKYFKTMTDRRLLCSVVFCVGVSILAIVTLHLFHVLGDDKITVLNDDYRARNQAYSSFKEESENSEYVIEGWYLDMVNLILTH